MSCKNLHTFAYPAGSGENHCEEITRTIFDDLLAHAGNVTLRDARNCLKIIRYNLCKSNI